MCFSTFSYALAGDSIPELLEDGVKIDFSETAPRDPYFAEVKYMEFNPNASFSELLGRLLFGVTTDVSPEYDKYGHEIRRYMSNVGNMKIYSNRVYLYEQLKNAKKARAIADVWYKKTLEDFSSLEKVMASDKTLTFAEKSNLRKSKVEYLFFVRDLMAWIDSNIDMLDYLYNSVQGAYNVYYPVVKFDYADEGVDFYNFFAQKVLALKSIKKYHAFSQMIY